MVTSDWGTTSTTCSVFESRNTTDTTFNRFDSTKGSSDFTDEYDSNWTPTITERYFKFEVEEEFPVKIKYTYPKIDFKSRKIVNTKPYHISVHKQAVLARFISSRVK